MSEITEASPFKKRKVTTFTNDDTKILVDLYIENYNSLYVTFKGPGAAKTSNQLRKNAWRKLTVDFNKEVSPDGIGAKTDAQVHNRIQYLRKHAMERAREKNKIKRMTGAPGPSFNDDDNDENGGSDPEYMKKLIAHLLLVHSASLKGLGSGAVSGVKKPTPLGLNRSDVDVVISPVDETTISNSKSLPNLMDIDQRSSTPLPPAPAHDRSGTSTKHWSAASLGLTPDKGGRSTRLSAEDTSKPEPEKKLSDLSNPDGPPVSQRQISYMQYQVMKLQHQYLRQQIEAMKKFDSFMEDARSTMACVQSTCETVTNFYTNNHVVVTGLDDGDNTTQSPNTRTDPNVGLVCDRNNNSAEGEHGEHSNVEHSTSHVSEHGEHSDVGETSANNNISDGEQHNNKGAGVIVEVIPENILD